MTFSEFGRRVAEKNGSSGTDHGSAAPIMLFGPALRGSGLVGKHPELTNLDKKGNMAILQTLGLFMQLFYLTGFVLTPITSIIL